MTEIWHGRTVAILLAAQEVRAETVVTESIPGTGGAIVFTSDRDGTNNLQVYRMNGDGYGQIRLSDAPGINQDPTWSADGKKIAFTTTKDGNNEVYRMRASDGANQVNLTNNPALDFLPAWQPLP